MWICVLLIVVWKITIPGISFKHAWMKDYLVNDTDYRL